MQPPSYCVPQPSFGQHCDKKHHNDAAHGKDDCRPAQPERPAGIMVDQQFYSYTKKSGFGEKVQGCGDKGYRKRAQQQGKDFHKDGSQSYDRKGKPGKPLAGGSVKSDHIQIQPHGDTVKQKGNIDGQFGVDEGRNGKHK